ncbi:hypothetical protein MSAN_00239300 [Mycena sanguinolenta]|uniref:Mid2 domain-containing protein n=1 Tax=Mycena sanguinolenta TaxID=230812 RepID=A0A8H7DMT7_9AGAR|nr:hypothetical protein MSAN_00239300 [Mycena sanguinolenta]
MLVRSLLLLLAATWPCIDALLNVSVDDTDMTMITYQGVWEASSTHTSSLDFGGSHTLSSDSAANATFVFTGVDVYYLSPRWPYNVSSRISIDGQPSVLVNLTDPVASTTPVGGSESAMYSVAWSATNLANTSHTVLVTYGDYVIVDGFIYTVDNGSSPISSSSAASSSAAPSSSSTSGSQSASATLAASSAGASVIPSGHKGLTIGLATALPLAALVAAALIAFALCYRRRGLQRRSTRTKFVLDDSPPAQPVYAAVSPPHPQMSSISASQYASSLAPGGGARYPAFSAASHAQMSSNTPSISSLP